ncbi:hypothetical protein [Spartinivicinus marinus]|nr:hypothetical protein [Spartinivicinus marinus]
MEVVFNNTTAVNDVASDKNSIRASREQALIDVRKNAEIQA